MRSWPLGRILAAIFLFGIVLVGYLLFNNFRDTRLADLKGAAAVEKNGKGAPVNQAPPEKAPNPEIAPPVIPLPAPPQKRWDGGEKAPPPGADTAHLAKARLQAIKAHASAINESLNQAEKEATAWQNLQKELFAGEAGRRIAANKDHVQQVATLLEGGRPAEASIKAWREQLKTMLAPVEKAENDEKNPFLPGDNYLKDLDKMAGAIKEFVRTYEKDRQSLSGILADSQGNKPADKGLKQAIQDLAEEFARKRASTIAEAKKAAFDEVTKKLAMAEAEAARLIGEEQAKLIAVKAAAEKTRLQVESEAAKRKAEKDRLTLLAKDPSIQAKYQAFLKPGYLQFTTVPETTSMFLKSERPEPVRFGALSAFGWLKDSKTFARAVSKCPNPFYQEILNDRPAHPYPRNADEWKQMDRMLEEFMELGPIWVEMGLLRP